MRFPIRWAAWACIFICGGRSYGVDVSWIAYGHSAGAFWRDHGEEIRSVEAMLGRLGLQEDPEERVRYYTCEVQDGEFLNSVPFRLPPEELPAVAETVPCAVKIFNDQVSWQDPEDAGDTIPDPSSRFFLPDGFCCRMYHVMEADGNGWFDITRLPGQSFILLVYIPSSPDTPSSPASGKVLVLRVCLRAG